MNNRNVSPSQACGYRLGQAWCWLKGIELRWVDLAKATGVPNAGILVRMFFWATQLGLLAGLAYVSYGLFILIPACIGIIRLGGERGLEEAPKFSYDMNGNHAGDLDYLHGVNDKW